MSAPVEHGLDCKCADCRLALVLFDALEASMRGRNATPSYHFGDVLAAAQAASTAGWRPPLTHEASAAAKLAGLRAAIEDHRDLGEAIALAIQDIYAGETFVDPTFERGTEAVLAVLRERLESPLPDSKTEWGWRPDPDCPDGVIEAVDEAAARERAGAARCRTLMQRRAAGPWIEVQS